MKRGLITIASLVCVVGSLVYAQQPSPAPAKIQVLVVTGQNGHNWRSTTPALRKQLEDTGRFEVRVTEEFRGAGPETLKPYDVVILNYYDKRNPDLRWGERAENALLDFVRSGKGLVVYHFSTAAFDGSTEFEKMSAGNWRPNNGHHSDRHDFTVKVVDPDHPITRGLPQTFAIPNDELYANLRWQPQGTYHVLATAYDDHSLYKGKAKQPTPGPGIDISPCCGRSSTAKAACSRPRWDTTLRRWQLRDSSRRLRAGPNGPPPAR